MKYLSEYENVIMDLILIEKVKHCLNALRFFLQGKLKLLKLESNTLSLSHCNSAGYIFSKYTVTRVWLCSSVPLKQLVQGLRVSYGHSVENLIQ